MVILFEWLFGLSLETGLSGCEHMPPKNAKRAAPAAKGGAAKKSKAAPRPVGGVRNTAAHLSAVNVLCRAFEPIKSN